MNRSTLRWGLLGLVAYLLFLLLTLPAPRIAAWVNAPLTEVQGSLWRGSATLVWQGEHLRNLHWRLRPVWPWQGVMGAELMAEHQGWQATGAVRLGWNGTLHVHDVTLSGPLDAPLLARRLPLPLSGQARLAIPHAVWQEGLREAEGVTLELFKPRLMLGEPLLLGDLAAAFEVREGHLDGRLHDKGGPLELAGQLQGDARSGLALEASLKARPGAPTVLADHLRLLPTTPEGGAHLATRLPAPWLAAPRQAD